jgi:preprotein translocase subunit YajC
VEVESFGSWILWAQAEGGGAPLGGAWNLPVMFAVFALAYIFLIHRPQKRATQQRESMLQNLKKNDRVITTSGIYGVVTHVQHDANEVTVRVDEANNTRLRLTLAAISRVLGDPANKGAAPTDVTNENAG